MTCLRYDVGAKAKLLTQDDKTNVLKKICLFNLSNKNICVSL